MTSRYQLTKDTDSPLRQEASLGFQVLLPRVTDAFTVELSLMCAACESSESNRTRKSIVFGAHDKLRILRKQVFEHTHEKRESKTPPASIYDHGLDSHTQLV